LKLRSNTKEKAMRFLPVLALLLVATVAANACDYVPRARLAFAPSCAPAVSFSYQQQFQFAPQMQYAPAFAQQDFQCQALGICPPASGPIYAPPVFRVPRAPVYDCPPVQTFAAPAIYQQRALIQRAPVYSAAAFAPVYAPPAAAFNVNVYSQQRSRGLLGGLLGGGRLFGGRDRDVFRSRTIVRGRGVGAAAFGY
jgi:hypothetical protein